MASEKLKDMLNMAIARELQVSIQYMWQHVQWLGVDHYSVSDKFREIAIEEMKHAEKIAERLLEYVDAGFSTALVEMPAPYDMETLERLAKEVRPMVEPKGVQS